MFKQKPVISPGDNLSARGMMLGIARSCRLPLASAVLFSMFANMGLLVLPIYMFIVMDKVMMSKNFNTLWMVYLIAFFALSFATFMDAMKSRVMVYVGTWIDSAIGSEALVANFYATLNKSGMSGRDVNEDVIEIRQFFSGHASMVFMDLPWVPFFLFLIFLFDFYLGLVAIGSGVVLAVLSFVQRYWVMPKWQRAERAVAQATRQSTDLLRNAEAVEPMGMRDRLIHRWRVAYDKALEDQEKSSFVTGAMAAFAKVFRLFVMMVTMTVAMIQIMDPNSYMTMGALMAAVIMISRVLMPMEQAISQFREFSTVISAFDRLAALLAEQARPGRKGVLKAEPQGHVKLDRVSVIVPSVGTILENVSCRLEPGEIVGVVGPSGAGKSTFGRVLVGIMEPQKGAVYLDGMDINSLDSDDYGRYIGYLPQDVTLFDGTVAANISRYDPSPDPNDIIAAAQIANLHETILRMPRGYDTRLSRAAGVVLSGGQMQRLALARALYRLPRLLVLDEPNSNLDAQGEKALFEALQTMKDKGTTIVVIAHRPNVLRIVDRIMMLDQGRVQRFGRPEDVNVMIPGRQAPQQIAGKEVSENALANG